MRLAFFPATTNWIIITSGLGCQTKPPNWYFYVHSSTLMSILSLPQSTWVSHHSTLQLKNHTWSKSGSLSLQDPALGYLFNVFQPSIPTFSAPDPLKAPFGSCSSLCLCTPCSSYLEHPFWVAFSFTFYEFQLFRVFPTTLVKTSSPILLSLAHVWLCFVIDYWALATCPALSLLMLPTMYL